MNIEETKITDREININASLKLTERDCPRCDAVLIHNNNEQCYECLNCGYINCGDD